ncbi:MAG: glycosyltransferase family 39 protein, partial [Terriglobales bacterium]
MPDKPDAAEGDSLSRYWPIAFQLAHGGGFSKNGVYPDAEEQPMYPAFMSLAYRFPHSRIVFVCMQATIGLLTAFLVYQTAFLAGLNARIALLLAALDPFLADFTRRFLRETLSTFAVALLLYVGIRAVRRPSIRWDMGLAAVAAFGISVGPDLVLTAVLV